MILLFEIESFWREKMKKQPIQAGKRKPPPHISVEFIFVIFHCFLKGCVWEIFVNVVVHTLHYLLVVQGGGVFLREIVRRRSRFQTNMVLIFLEFYILFYMILQHWYDICCTAFNYKVSLLEDTDKGDTKHSSVVHDDD